LFIIARICATAAAPPANRNPSTFSLSIQHALQRFVYKIVERLFLYNVVLITIHLCSLTLFAAYDWNSFCYVVFSCSWLKNARQH